MSNQGIVVGQRVWVVKQELARRLRRQMTTAEQLLWQHLRGGSLAGLHFRRQQVIDGFIVDFYCHSAKLVVEVDGSVHRQQQDYDQERDRLLSARGLLVVRVGNDQVLADLPHVLEALLAAAVRENA